MKHSSLIPVLSKQKTSLCEFKASWVYIAGVPGKQHRETLSPKDRNKMNKTVTNTNKQKQKDPNSNLLSQNYKSPCGLISPIVLALIYVA